MLEACNTKFNAAANTVDKFGLSQESVERSFKEAGLPFPGKELVAELRASSLNCVHVYLAAAMQEVHRIALVEEEAAAAAAASEEAASSEQQAVGSKGKKVKKPVTVGMSLQQPQEKLVHGAVSFTFKVHQFVRGLDEKAAEQFEELRTMLQQVESGSFVPDAAKAPAAKPAAVKTTAAAAATAAEITVGAPTNAAPATAVPTPSATTAEGAATSAPATAEATPTTAAAATATAAATEACLDKV